MRTAKEISKKSDESILFNYNDLLETIKVQEKMNREGYNTPKLGQYHDEMHLYAAEAKKRNLIR